MSLLQVKLSQVLRLQVFGDFGRLLKKTLVVRFAPNCGNLIAAKVLALRVAEKGSALDHKVGVQMQLAAEDVLQSLADGLPEVLDLLAQHHALWRVNTAIKLIVLGAEVFAWIEHVVSQLEAKVQNGDAQISPALV